MTELTFAQAVVSPCASCDTTPCCRRAPLDTFALRDVLDLDHARFLLNFEGIELGVTSDGCWQVFLLEPCRLLDVDHGRCTVHGTVEQPEVCRTYSAHRCWYRPAIDLESDPEHLRVDRRRLDYVLDRVVLDEQRRIIAVPAWDELTAAFGTMPITPPAGPDQSRANEGQKSGGAPPLADDHPCTGCAAWCCTTLPFGIDVPVDAAGLEHMRFLLGFPSVSLVVADTGWTLAVETRCRHLVGTTCSVMGDPSRPLRCGDHDAWSCRYPEVLAGEAGPHVRVGWEDFPVLAAALPRTADGRIDQIPPAAVLRSIVDDTPHTELLQMPASGTEATPITPRDTGNTPGRWVDAPSRQNQGRPEATAATGATDGPLVGMALPVIGASQLRHGRLATDLGDTSAPPR